MATACLYCAIHMTYTLKAGRTINRMADHPLSIRLIPGLNQDAPVIDHKCYYS